MKEMNDNIDFVDIPSGKSDSSAMPHIEFETPLPKKKQYANWYEELLDKCKPSNFTKQDPYDSRKVQFAMYFYETLRNNKKKYNVPDDMIPEELKELRRDAVNNLGIDLSTQRIFDIHKKIVAPIQFDDEHDYDPKALEKANRLYSELLKIKNDLEQLEEFALDEDYQYLLALKSKSESEKERFEREKREYWEQYK